LQVLTSSGPPHSRQFDVTGRPDVPPQAFADAG